MSFGIFYLESWVTSTFQGINYSSGDLVRWIPFIWGDVRYGAHLLDMTSLIVSRILNVSLRESS